MTASDKAVELLKSTEAPQKSSIHGDGKYYPYNDSEQIPTIGYGHKIQKGEDFSKGITSEQTDALFKKDMNVKENYMHSNVTAKLTQNKWDALLFLTYNFGSYRPKI